MAYKQNPGRGPMLKTGRGIPSGLLQKEEEKPTENKIKRHPGYEPLKKPEQLEGNSIGSQVVNNNNNKWYKEEAPKHDKKDLETKWVGKGDRLGRNQYVIDIDDKTGDYFTRREGQLPVYRVPRRKAKILINTGSEVGNTFQKIKYGYNQDGRVYQVNK